MDDKGIFQNNAYQNYADGNEYEAAMSLMNDIDFTNLAQHENVTLHYEEAVFLQTSISHPNSPNLPGDYNFNVTVNNPEKDNKGASWIYCPSTEKLYIKMNVPCPIIFSTNNQVPNDTYIRSVVFFTQPQYMDDVVHRCYHHATEDQLNGLHEALHLTRCENVSVSYDIDEQTKRNSVVVPYNPQYEMYKYSSTFIYKFLCLNSCVGGPNRRPTVVMFTLERGKDILGRKRIYLKVCSCPGRDKSAEDGKRNNLGPNKTLKRKPELGNLIKEHKFPDLLQHKKFKSKKEGEKKFTIKVQDKACYLYLVQVKKLYEMHKIIRKFFISYDNQSGDSVKEETESE